MDSISSIFTTEVVAIIGRATFFVVAFCFAAYSIYLGAKSVGAFKGLKKTMSNGGVVKRRDRLNAVWILASSMLMSQVAFVAVMVMGAFQHGITRLSTGFVNLEFVFSEGANPHVIYPDCLGWYLFLTISGVLFGIFISNSKK